jgi:sugar/nucleoside kinase (ribokinase family)
MVKVTVLGDINADIITSQISRLPKKDNQITIDSIILQPGGSSFNTALACARMRMKTRFIGKIGNDEFSKYLLKIGKSFGVDMRVKVDRESKTGATMAINFDDGERSFITFKGPNDTLKMSDFDLKKIKGQVLCISGFNLLDGLRKDVRSIFEYVRNKGMITVLDPNWDPQGWGKERLRELKRVLKETDIFLPDIDEARMVSRRPTPNLMLKRIMKMGPQIVALKMGKKGCMIGYEDRILKISAPQVKPIHTVGPGDVFTAAFLKSYLGKKSLYYCGKFAVYMASKSTTKSGLDRYPKFGGYR